MLLTVAKEVVVEHWASRVETAFRSTILQGAGDGGRQLLTGPEAERAPIVVNFSYSVSGRFRLFAIRNDPTRSSGPNQEITDRLRALENELHELNVQLIREGLSENLH